jgi:hypothetical protein
MEHATAGSAAIAKELVRLGLLKRHSSGRYVPTTREAIIKQEHPYLAEHVAHSVVRLIETVLHNSQCHSPEGHLFERSAHVTNFDIGKLRAFQDFSYQQGRALIETTNDWLEANKSTRRTGKMAEAGLHIYAYVGKKPPVID